MTAERESKQHSRIEVSSIKSKGLAPLRISTLMNLAPLLQKARKQKLRKRGVAKTRWEDASLVEFSYAK